MRFLKPEVIVKAHHLELQVHQFLRATCGARDSSSPITKLKTAPIAIRLAEIKIDVGALRNFITLSDYS
jgi:hypothetical protein